MIEAVIFDMDGVISDTQKLHSRVESDLLNKFGIKLSPEEITRRYSGVKTSEFFNDLLRRQDKEYDLDKLMADKWEKMAALSDTVSAISGADELIKKLHENKIPMVVASASNKNYVDSILDKLGLSDFFKAVISGDMVTKGKPDPQIFLLAAQKAGVSPKKCVVIEDGRSGMEAARAAGMKCIGLVKDISDQYPTSILITSLAELTPEFIKSMPD
jgi:beta-phosphoglucomutase family hydrolase